MLLFLCDVTVNIPDQIRPRPLIACLNCAAGWLDIQELLMTKEIVCHHFHVSDCTKHSLIAILAHMSNVLHIIVFVLGSFTLLAMAQLTQLHHRSSSYCYYTFMLGNWAILMLLTDRVPQMELEGQESDQQIYLAHMVLYLDILNLKIPIVV